MARLDTRLDLERLGSRILPSASPVAAHSAPVFLGPPVVQPNPPLSGHGHGSYFYDAVESGAGIEYRMSGTAALPGMGTVGVRGSVHSVGFIQKGHAGGELTFGGPHGSITLELTGPTQAGFSPLPTSFTVRVVAETGAYAGRHWHQGRLTLNVIPAPTAVGVPPRGVFTLALNLPSAR
jgi:hypothetical protein